MKTEPLIDKAQALYETENAFYDAIDTPLREWLTKKAKEGYMSIPAAEQQFRFAGFSYQSGKIDGLIFQSQPWSEYYPNGEAHPRKGLTTIMPLSFISLLDTEDEED